MTSCWTVASTHGHVPYAALVWAPIAYCNGCSKWVHKKCSGLKRVIEDVIFRCARCNGTARTIDGRPVKEVQVGEHKLEVVASFCYLGDTLSAGGGCELATTTRVNTGWKKFKELLPILTTRHLSYKIRGHIYNTCVRSAMLRASKTWALTSSNLQRLQRSDRAMIRWICNVKAEIGATGQSKRLLAQLGIEDMDIILRQRRLRWYGHVERSAGAARHAWDLNVDRKRGPVRPKITWKQLIDRDRKKWGLTDVEPT